MKKLIAVAAVAASAMAAALPMSALATDLEDFYFRYDFSGGTKQFIGSASQAIDPISTDWAAGYFETAYDVNDVATAVHINSTSYGTDRIGGSAAVGRTVLAGDWTLAMSLKPGDVNRGLLFSLGRANDTGNKAIFLASSSSPGKFYVGTARRMLKSGTYSNSNTRELAYEWELTTSANLTRGYHTIVAVHTTGGSVSIYIDGEQAYIGDDPTATSLDTTLNCSAATCVFGNGIQFNQAHGTSTFLNNVGYSQSSSNPDVAFRDVRLYNSAFTAEDAAAYAALYPPTATFRPSASVRAYGENAIDTGYLVKPTTRIAADFQYTEVVKQARIFGVYGDLGCNLYINGSTKFSCAMRDGGNGWTSFDVAADTRRRFATLDRANNSAKLYYDGSIASKALGGTATNTASIKLPLFAELQATNADAGNFSKSLIYSIGIQESGTPVHFFAPATNETGAAGFYDVIGNVFHGESIPSPSTALSYTPGFGSAADYKYESDTLYAKIYAAPYSTAIGSVVVRDGEGAVIAPEADGCRWIPYGTNVTLTATPAAGYVFAGWVGDTWAITGGSASDAIVTITPDRVAQLCANFERPANPVSAYAQSGTPELIAHLDAIENVGAGMHQNAAPTWIDLTGNLTLTKTGSAGFIADAWKADGSSCFQTSSTAAKDALAAKAFTLELVISNPGGQVKDSYEYWTFFGNDSSHRQLVVDLREKNSSNPLVQGVQYRESEWNTRSQFSTSTITAWNKRQYIVVVCDSTGATTYCNGTNQIHKTGGGSVNPSQEAIFIGADYTGSGNLYNNSEICAVRMTSRVLTADERLRNWYVDSQRFILSDSPDGYRFVDGAIEVRVTKGIPGFEFSTDGGTTWSADEVWAPINAELTLTGRYVADSTAAVPFTGLPDGAVVSGNSVTFTPSRAYDISAGLPTLDLSGSAVWSEAAWQLGGASCTAPASGDAIINLVGNAVLTLDGDVALDTLELNGSGTLAIFTDSHTFSASAIDVPSGVKYVICDGADDGTVFWIGGESGNLGDATKWSTGVVPGPGTNAVITAAAEAALTNGAAFKATTIMFPVGSPKVTIEGEVLSGIEAICNQSAANHEFKAAVDADAIAINNTDTYCVFTGGLTANSVSFGVADNTKAAIYGTWHIKGDWTPVKGNALYDGASVTVDGALLNPNNLSINSGCVVTAATVNATGSCGYLTYSNNGRLVVTGLCSVTTTVDGYLTRKEANDNATVEFGSYYANTPNKWAYVNAKHVIVGAGGMESDTKRINFYGSPTLHSRTAGFELNCTNGGQFLSESSGVTIDTTQYETEYPATVTINGVFGYNSARHGKINVTGCGKILFNSVSTFTEGLTVSDTATVAVNAGMVPGNGLVTVNAGATLAVAQSGTVSLGGGLTLADGAALGFNFTERGTAPVLDVTDKTVTVNGTVNVKVSADAGIRPSSSRTHTLTSGYDFTDKTVNLVDPPDWVQSVGIDGGNIVLTVKPVGLVIIFQ